MKTILQPNNQRCLRKTGNFKLAKTFGQGKLYCRDLSDRLKQHFALHKLVFLMCLTFLYCVYQTLSFLK